MGYGEFDSGDPKPGVYETVELVFEPGELPGNPFTQFAHVAFSQGTERYEIDGFYDGRDNDGDPVYRARFMPTHPGTWHYEWSIGSQHQRGAIAVQERRDPNNHGHVRVDKTNPSVLLYDDGSAHYWYGGKWFLAQNYGPLSKQGESNAPGAAVATYRSYYSNEQLDSYLELMMDHGHNGALLKLGYFPLEDDKLSWDLEWIRRADRLITAMRRRNIYCQVSFFDPWSRRTGSWFETSGDPNDHVLNAWSNEDDDAKQNYIRYVVARLAGYSNVYWELVDRVDAPGESAGAEFVEQANTKYLPWLRAFDPYDLPVGGSDVEWARQMPDLDIEFPRDDLRSYNPDSRRAVVLNDQLHSCLDKTGSPDSARDDATIREPDNRHCYRESLWEAFVLGGYGAVEAPGLDLNEPPNNAVVEVMRDHQRLRSIVAGLHSELPDLVNNPGFVESASAHVGTRAKLGQTYISYFNPGQPAESIEVRLEPGRYQFRWLLPGDPDLTPAQTGTVESNTASTSLDRPAFEEDLVLIIERIPEPP